MGRREYSNNRSEVNIMNEATGMPERSEYNERSDGNYRNGMSDWNDCTDRAKRWEGKE